MSYPLSFEELLEGMGVLNPGHKHIRQITFGAQLVSPQRVLSITPLHT